MPVADREVLTDVLLSELRAVAARSVGVIRDAVPAYRSLTGPQVADVEALAAWAVDGALRRWCRPVDGPVTLGVEERARVRAIGAARAADGRPVSEILRAYRLGSALLLREVAALGRGRVDADDVAALGEIVVSLLGELSDLVAESYAANLARQASDRERACSELLDDLLIGRQTSPGALRDRADQLELDLPLRPVTVVTEALDPARAVTRGDLAAAAAELDAPTAATDPPHGSGRDDASWRRGRLVTARGNRGVLLLPAAVTSERIGALCIDRAWRACAVTGASVHETADCYRLATAALDTAPPHAFASRAVLDRGDAAVLSLLGARPVIGPDAVVNAVLGPLLPEPQAHLLEGLTTFVTAGSAAAAASVLHLHVQTVRYRLRRVQQLTGRDPQDPWQLTVLAVAVQLHRAASAPGRPG